MDKQVSYTIEENMAKAIKKALTASAFENSKKIKETLTIEEINLVRNYVNYL